MIPGFYFCICPDIFLSKQHIENMLLSFPTSWQTNLEKHTFWPDEVDSNLFWNTLTLQSLTASPKLIFIRQANEILAEQWKKISKTLGTPRSEILPIFFLENAFEKSSPKIPAHLSKLKCYEFAKKKEWFYSDAGITDKNINIYFKKELQKVNLQMENEVFQKLCENLIYDAYFIQSLIAQLTLLSENGKITSSVFSHLKAFTPEMKIFDLINSMERANFTEVWNKLNQEDDKGESYLFNLLAILASNARKLWNICAGNTSQIYPGSNYKISQAKKLGFQGVSEIFQMIFEADLAVKSGQKSQLQALETLITSYTNLFAGKKLNNKKIFISEKIMED